jgi:hypothetical protein
MRGTTERSVWAFDLDGCLVGMLSTTDLRPLARDVLERLRAAGVTIVVWSAGGAVYARSVAERVGISELVEAFYDKRRGPDGKWVLDEFALHHRPRICVDDEPDGVPAEVRTFAVSAYLGRRPHDRGFQPILDEIELGDVLPPAATKATRYSP